MPDFNPEKGEFGLGNGINEYNDQEEQAKRAKQPQAQPRRRADAQQADGDDDGGNDPVSDLNAGDAIASIERMRSRDKLQAIVDTDQRATVKAAAEKRLGELG